jgi:phosphoglucomutase
LWAKITTFTADLFTPFLRHSTMSTGLDALTRQKVQAWIAGPYDTETKSTLQQLLDADNDTELADAFYKDLEFGTGGLRGLIGIGSNRMNRYTVGAATQGLANYLKKSFPDQEIKVAVAHDSRNKSTDFAEVTADVFSANGIRVFLFKELRPTPELSFAIRLLGCQSGVVVTASHNPKEYNGYKAYWDDGAQVVAPHDKAIIAEVAAIQSVEAINFQGNPDLVTLIGEEVDEQYLEQVIAKNVVNKEVIHRQHDLKIVYTPIHGTGITLVPRALARIGFSNVSIVQEQATPDGNFPTVVYPNPEEKEAMTLAMNQAKAEDADLVMATDPDADRVGSAVKNDKGEWQLLNGNQMASLLIFYLLRAWKDAGKLTGTEFVAKTIVTTDLINKMCERYGVKCYDTLTGFKYIAGVIRDLQGKEQFIGGGEESYGYLIGDAVRDKDAIASCAMIAELTAYAKDQGLSLFDLLTEMYMENGFYYEGLISLTKKGREGAAEIQRMMTDLRNNPPADVAGSKPVAILDYENLVRKDVATGQETPIAVGMGIEKSNVIQLLLADGSKVSARPSGTEPKIKFYVSVNAPLTKPGDFDAVYESLKAKVARIQEELGLK